MKKTFLLLFLSINTLIFSYGMPEGYINYLYEFVDTEFIMFDKEYIPTSYETSVIYHILSNTKELNIHKMRGEVDNIVIIFDKDSDGFYGEAVFDKNKNHVENGYNDASGNFYLYSIDPIKHFNHDMLPWLLMGNSEKDPSDFNERLYYYLQDLDYGIQSYIFEGKNSDLKTIDFSKLSQSEKYAYQFFASILFGKEFKTQLNESNKEKLKKDGDFYRGYYKEVKNALGFEG